MSHARYIIGDTRDVVASMADGSVDLVICSPPFLALRSYLPPGHRDKAREIGSEATPAEFLQVLLELAAEWRRVLTRYGSIAIELGDTYAGSGGAGGDYNEGGLREGQEKFDGSGRRGAARAGGKDGRPTIPAANGYTVQKSNAGRTDDGPGWPMDKSLCGLPHLFHLSLAYGMNLLTGEPSPAGQWRVRNVIAWTRPNPPVGSLGDKFRPATSYMTIATPYRDRYFDLEATRQPASPNTNARTAKGVARRASTGKTANDELRGGNWSTLATEHEGDGTAPPLDWWYPLEEEEALWDAWADELWRIPTAPYKGSHYATWPPALCVRPIESMVPRRVCTTCGQPSRRIVDTERHPVGETTPSLRARDEQSGNAPGGDAFGASGSTTYTTVGWTDCGHDTWRNGIALDPFAGSGTTLAVATGHGRDAIGIDIDDRNAVLALERVGPLFLTVEVHEPPSTEETA